MIELEVTHKDIEEFEFRNRLKTAHAPNYVVNNKTIPSRVSEMLSSLMDSYYSNEVNENTMSEITKGYDFVELFFIDKKAKKPYSIAMIILI